MTKSLAEFCRKHALIQPGDRILVAVSGGVDSVVLLDLLRRLCPEWQLELCVAHFNHRLRGEESDEDEQFVKTICAEMQTPVFTEAQDVAEYSQANKLSIEMGARELRYQFLDRVAAENDCQRIAFGHTADDQAETILDRVMRGTGVAGLTGIPIRRGKYIRPLLFASRRQIMAHADEFGLHFRYDSSNDDLSYKRNRIRHLLLPQIKKDFNPKVVAALNHLGAIMMEVDAFLREQGRTAYLKCLRYQDADKIVLDIIAFLAYFTPLQNYILRHALDVLGDDPRRLDFQTTDRMVQLLRNRRPGKEIKLDSGLTMRLSSDALVLSKAKRAIHRIEITEMPGKYNLWQGLVLEIKAESKPLEQVLFQRDPNIEWIDADLMGGPVCVRTFRAGDRFHPLNLKGSKKLSDFFVDEKVPFYLRDSVPILECGSGIVWICGYRLDDRYKVTDSSKRIFRLALSKELDSANRI